jgi:hypothetical protein
MIATQTGASCRCVGSRLKEDVRVALGSFRSGALVPLAMAMALSDCGSDIGWDSGWFRKPMDVFGHNSGYTYSDLKEASLSRSITDNDLVDASGNCPPPAAPQQAQPAAAASPAPPAPSDASLLGGGVGLGMSECEVVYRAGHPTSVEIGKNPNGDRTAVLTYLSGPRPGIYRFGRGRLMELDRVAEPAPPPQAIKKKPAKTKKPAAGNNAA